MKDEWNKSCEVSFGGGGGVTTKKQVRKDVRNPFNVTICITMWGVKYSLLDFICYHERKLTLYILF